MDMAEAIPQQERFARHIEDGKACHTLFHTLNEFERVSDSPTQGKELKANPDIFLTWSVMAFIRYLRDRNLLPKDDQIISQLKKSFSKACGNLASGLSSSAVFVTLKRRQLPLCHMVPSVSDVLTWILLSDHFISPGGGGGG